MSRPQLAHSRPVHSVRSGLSKNRSVNRSAGLAFWVAMGLVVLAVACSGGDKQVEEPEPVDEVTEPEPEPEPVEISAEEFDAVKRFFDRKSRT